MSGSRETESQSYLSFPETKVSESVSRESQLNWLIQAIRDTWLSLAEFHMSIRDWRRMIKHRHC